MGVLVGGGGAGLHPAGGVNGSSRGAVSRQIHQPLLEFSVTENVKGGSRLDARLKGGDWGGRGAPVTRSCLASLTEPFDAQTKRRLISACWAGRAKHCESLHCVPVWEYKAKNTLRTTSEP